jgi:Fe-Mn family superoxide dismutase
MISRNMSIVVAAIVLVALMGGGYIYKNRKTLFQDLPVYTLPPLPYAFNALEPHIDAETMKIHYTKHHQAYVDKLNATLKDYPDVRKKTLEYLLTHKEEIPDSIRATVLDNAGGHINHSFFWLCMTPEAFHEPMGKIEELLKKSFGDLKNFKEQFYKAAMSIFGSGWAWLVLAHDGTLKIVTTPNQDSPLSIGLIPLLGLDLWEHAYYLRYQNRRNEYSDAWWHVVNWEQVEKNYESAQKRIELKGT